MAADAAGSSSLSVPELQRQLAELAEELRVRKEAEGFALQREAAIAEILSVINDPDANLSRVFDVLVEKATQLCSASYGHIWLYDGERARAVAAFAQKQFGDWLRDRESVPSKVTPLGQVLLHHRLVHVVDATAHEGYQKHAGFRELVDRGGIRTLLHVPLRKGGKLLGIITVYRQEGRPFSDRQITLLESFAAQAVIAMENARLFTEQREALEQQTATAEVLQVINTSPGDLAPVFDAMLDKAMTLCGAAFGFLTSYDGQRFTAVAMRGVPPSLAKYFAKGVDQPSPGEMHYRILHGEDVIHNLDQKDEEAYRSGLPLRRAVVDLGGGRTALVIALRKDGALLGILTIYRKEVRPFSDKQIALMRNFSAQAVIAIENARLLTEQREALERQTATAQVLQVINESPGDLAPVFDAMLERAVDLGEASFGIMNVYEDGEFRAVALRGVPDGLIEQWAAAPPPSARNALTRMFDGEDVVHIEDLAAYETYQAGDLRTRALVEIGGARSLLAVALRKEGVFLGSITAYRQEVRPFTDKQITLLQNFAAQAVIAMENARLLVELRASLEQQTATSDVLKTISRSSVDLEAVLKMLVETVARLCRADQSYMWRRREELYQLVAAHGLSDEARAFVETHPIAPDDRGTLNGRVSLERRTVHIPDTLQDADYRYSGQQITGFRTLLGIPLLREDVLIGIFNVARTRVDPFTDKEIELAASFADQAVIAIENARLFEELRERQAELRVTFDNMDDGVAMFDAEPRLVAWNRNFEQIVGMPEVRLAERPSYAEYLRLLAERGEFGTENVEAELASRLENTERELRMERTRADGTVIEVRRNAVPGGGFVLNYSDVTEQRRAEAAIRAARDAAEAALERQTATADILKVIASSPTDVHPVLEAVVKAAVRFCSATDAMIQLCEGDSVISTTHEGPLTYSAGVRRPLDRTTAGGRSIIDAQTCHLPDVEASDAAEFVTARKLGAQHGFRASVAAPLKRDGAAIGALVLRKVEPGPFTPQQIYLLETFAAQAVIAIENVRLFTELRESLEQQTATAEILTVISQSPTDVAPVLSAVAGAAMKFCGANDALVGLRDGNEWFIAAHEGPIETIIGTRRMLTRHTAPGRAMADGKVIQIKDLHSDDGNEFPEGREIGARTGFRSALAAPLLRDDVSVGAISLRRREAGEFEPRQVELLKTFAAQAVIAIQNVRLFSELRESLEQQTATAEILQAISQSPTDVQPVLDAVVKAALRFCGATDAVVILRESDDAVVAAHDGPLLMPPGSSFPLNLQTASGQAILGGLTCHFPDIPSLDRVEFAASHRIAAAQGFRAAVSAPLLRKGVAIGSVALRKAESGPFTPRQIELLETFAAQAVIAIENVRLFTELRDSLERLKAAQANLIQAEKMASLGQLTAGIAHEIKNPLNFVNNFSGLSVELLDDLKQAVDALLVEPDENKRAELQDTMDLLTGNLAKIVEHGRRADGIVKSMLSHSRGGKGDWQDSNINALVEEALNLAYHGARAQDQDFNVTLERDFASEPKSIEVVPQDVTRVFLNLFGNGFYATRKRHLGGADAGYRPTLTVSTRDLGDAVEVTVRDNGTGIQPAVRAKLFQPFFTTKPTGEGTGLGLSISYDIVTQQHGGSIDVESEPGYFTEFTVRLPRRRRAA